MLSAKIEDNEFYKDFSKKFKSLTATGKAPWLKEGVPDRAIAHNPSSGVIFRGVNAMMLEMSAAEKGYKESRWISAYEIEKLGLKPRYREEPTPIAYINRYQHPTDVHPSFGLPFNNKDIPKEKYYYMYNIEQLKEYSKIKDIGFTLDSSIIKEKEEALKINAKTNDFDAMSDAVSKMTVESAKMKDNNLNIIMNELSRFRLSQELNKPWTPTTSPNVIKNAVNKVQNADSIVHCMYNVELTKDRCLSPNLNIDNEKVRRTVVKSNEQQRHGMSM